MSKPTNAYEILPCQMFLPAAPIPHAESLSRQLNGGGDLIPTPRTILTSGLTTLPASVGDAQVRTGTLLRPLQRDMSRGKLAAIARILSEHPELALHPAVHDRLARWSANETLRCTRGRPRGSTRWSPLAVVGVVNHLCSSAVAPSKERAFAMLEPLGLKYDTAKRLYYQAYRETRFAALLFTDESRARRLSAEELKQLTALESLQCGRPIHRTAEISELGGPVDLTFSSA